MSRKVFRAVSNGETTTAVIQTAASGGGQWGRPVRLSTVEVANSDLNVLNGAKINGNPKVKTLESWVVDSSSQGPRSKYGKTLAAMLDELPGHVPNAKVDTGRIDAEDMTTLAEMMKAKALEAKLEANTAPALSLPNLNDAATLASVTCHEHLTKRKGMRL